MMWKFAGLQNYQCFSLTSQNEISIPWTLLQDILGRDIMTFDSSIESLHENLHRHGNGVYNYMVKRVREHDRTFLDTFNGFNIMYRHLWLQVTDFQLSTVQRGEQWFDTRQLCEENALKNPYPGILTVETACQCYVVEQCNGWRCPCVCHARPCTHELSDFTPFLERCHCTSAIRHELNDGEVICRAPYTKLGCYNTQFVFYLEQARYWFTSHERNPVIAYHHHIINHDPCKHKGAAKTHPSVNNT